MITPGTREDLKEFFLSHKGRLNVSFEVLETALKDWAIWKIETDKPIAVVVSKDGIGHIACFNGNHVGIPLMKRALKLLQITKTAVSNNFRPGHILAKRLGFIIDHVENGVTYYVRQNIS